VITLNKHREELMEEIVKEMLGPGSEIYDTSPETEIISDLPEVRYSVGILFPQKNLIDLDDDEVDIGSNSIEVLKEEVISQIQKNDSQENVKETKKYLLDFDKEKIDEQISLSTQNMPSSMGFSFIVERLPQELTFDIEFGTYDKVRLEKVFLPHSEIEEDYIPDELKSYVSLNLEKKRIIPLRKFTKRDLSNVYKAIDTVSVDLKYKTYRLAELIKGFQRTQHKIVDFKVALQEDKMVYEYTRLEEMNIGISVLVRETKSDLYSITIMLINQNFGTYNGLNSIFQPKISIHTDSNRFEFKPFPLFEDIAMLDDEEKSLELIYRNKLKFATGHGTSTKSDINLNGKGSIQTDFIPTYEVPRMEFNILDENIDSNVYSMKYLSDLNDYSKKDKLDNLNKIVKSYSAWIDTLEIQSKELEGKYTDIAQKHINDCRRAAKRMTCGIEILEKDVQAYNSFMLANRSMFMQRIHSKFQKIETYPGDIELQKVLREINYKNEVDSDSRWRPFQIAFLLLSIEGIVSDREDRDLVDLIWFPTGGGKTEAYLGLTAFTIFYRRLKFSEESKGTTVIMRYTLRLLASQQFSRASILICACESIRKDNYKTKSLYPKYNLGKDEISIGLWIGGTHTPNKNQGEGGAINLLNELEKSKPYNIESNIDKYNKFQLLKCPWCGTKMIKQVKEKKIVGQWGYGKKKNKYFYLFCTQEGCEFEKSLPVQIVDEELYKNPPTLLFGTVDKFAMIPWKNEIGSFFATHNSNRTPELIIQDELHLISGPLGTMVGLYETLIDTLCSHKGNKPKIIASTATIRRAMQQCAALYNRKVKQFPPPGLIASDSYFAREKSVGENSNRLYVGLMPSGKTKAVMQIRAYATALQKVNEMDWSDSIKDKFWTVTAYFNSLRDLGKASNLVDDDVKDYMMRLNIRNGSKNRRFIGQAHELTSRVSTNELNKTLELLENKVYSKEAKENKTYPSNIVLATNMISVGVDVARLNLMFLIGQPKLTSEYIQASSRIGRTYPGVAITLYDSTKSRDRSHYEQFVAYHEAFYKFVEPTVVTPFSKPARERGLHAIQIGLMRHIYGISEDKDASLFDLDMESVFNNNIKAVQEINSLIQKRIQEVEEKNSNSIKINTEELEIELNNFWEDWQRKVNNNEEGNLLYGEKYIVQSSTPVGIERLMRSFGSETKEYNSIETMTSLRNVDKSITAGIVMWED